VSVGDGVRLAVTLLTVAPMRAGHVDARSAATAMVAAPAVGLALGALAGGVLAGAVAAGAPPLLGAVLAVGLVAGLTRGMHLDGLADTADGFGCYGEPERALAVMRKSDVGPFGVVALVLTLLAQVSALSAVAGRPAWQAWLGAVVAVGAGRTALPWACRRGVPAARPEGLGALVAGSVPAAVAAAWTVALAALAVLAVPGRLWLGPLAVVAGVAGAIALVGHAVRRFGGITGDVLGAAVEVATTVSVVALALSP
jgi:adenosylcobinamide-GDP ribazoletransferase